MWRPSSASGDTRQRREHDIKRQEKDDTVTVKTYQNKLNSQSYSRLKMPTMAGRPTLFPSVEVSAFAGARSNVECQLSPGQSAGVGWEAVGERFERTAAAWGQREDARQSNSGHPGLVCARVYLGESELREWTAKVLGELAVRCLGSWCAWVGAA